MGDGSRISWRERLHAWWEGYDLSTGRKQGGKPHGADGAKTGMSRGPAAAAPQSARNTSRFGKPLWTATRIEVAEKCWGAGFTSPGSANYIPELIKPLGLNPAMSVLDVSAGLGGVARVMAANYGAWVTGLEANPVLAEVGMQQSTKAGMARQAPITHYDPNTFKPSKRFDCVVSKEFFFTVKARAALMDAIEMALKPRGQLLFTDYVLVPGTGGGKALQAFYDQEPVEPHLVTLVSVEEEMAQRNLDLRIAEDITDAHKSAIIAGIAALKDHLEHYRVDDATREAVLAEVELWARRMAALDDGLRLYRFYALKPSDELT